MLLLAKHRSGFLKHVYCTWVVPATKGGRREEVKKEERSKSEKAEEAEEREF